MAIYNEILAGRYAKALAKLFSIKGPNPAKQLAGEISASLPLFYGSECRFLEGWNRFGQGFAGAAGVAAQNMGIRLRNPGLLTPDGAKNGAIVAVIEKIILQGITVADNAIFLQHGPQTADLSTIVGGTLSRWDPRGNPQPVLIGSTQANTASSGGTKWQGALTTTGVGSFVDVIVTDIQEIPLLPGDGLQVLTTAVNTTFNMFVWWRERVLEESEIRVG